MGDLQVSNKSVSVNQERSGNNRTKIQKVYSLSPMQEGMLFHSIMESDNNSYYQQMVFTVEGEFDAHLFRKESGHYNSEARCT